MEYHKIQSIFKRNEKGSFIDGDFSCPEFSYLFNNNWIGTEKIDGTNIRVYWDGRDAYFYGRTNKAQIPEHLLAELKNIFNNASLFEVFGEKEIILFGEGYGSRIQKGGGNYIKDGTSFILFDVLVESFWLRRDNIMDIANELKIKYVPEIFRGTLKSAIDFTKKGFASVVAETETLAEGLVLIPEVHNMFNHQGKRIITKIKTKDFK